MNQLIHLLLLVAEKRVAAALLRHLARQDRTAVELLDTHTVLAALTRDEWQHVQIARTLDTRPDASNPSET